VATRPPASPLDYGARTGHLPFYQSKLSNSVTCSISLIWDRSLDKSAMKKEFASAQS